MPVQRYDRLIETTDRRRAGTSAIVLAGGRSARFGRDKLAEPVDGRALLLRTIDRVAPLAAEVVVVRGFGDARAHALPSGVRGAAVRIVNDATEGGGPVAGVLAGADAAANDLVLVVGGDTPWLVADVLRMLIDRAATAGRCAVLGTGAGADAPPQPLPFAAPRRIVVATAGTMLDAGERRLAALMRLLGAAEVPPDEWRLVDPRGDSLRDIDTPDDLRAAPPW